jgi:hypothetical protein
VGEGFGFLLAFLGVSGRVLNLLGEVLQEVGVVGLREVEGFGHGLLSFGDAARSEQYWAEYGMDIGRIGLVGRRFGRGRELQGGGAGG